MQFGVVLFSKEVEHCLRVKRKNYNTFRYIHVCVFFIFHVTLCVLLRWHIHTPNTVILHARGEKAESNLIYQLIPLQFAGDF